MSNNCNNCNECNEQTREELMKAIREYNFAIIELALYLDTHPNDERALCKHNEYCEILKRLEDKYQKKYGPLTIKIPCGEWRWLEGPLPWEREAN